MKNTSLVGILQYVRNQWRRFFIFYKKKKIKTACEVIQLIIWKKA